MAQQQNQGGGAGGTGGTSDGKPSDLPGRGGPLGTGGGSLVGMDDGGIASEAAALGDATGSLADAAGNQHPRATDGRRPRVNPQQRMKA